MLIALAAVCAFLCAAPTAYPLVYLYQQSGYRFRETLRAIRRKSLAYFAFALSVTVSSAALGIALSFLRPPFHLLCVLSICLPSVITIYHHLRARVKLKLTARLCRFCACFAAISGCFAVLYAIYLPALIPVVSLVLPVAFALAHALTYPVERARNRRYAVKSCALIPPTALKVGITGSYGKTTARNILSHFLAARYDVVATTGNYNTPMGIAKSVQGSVTPHTEAFVAEMGARYKGDIAELCALIKPTHALITAIGNQHLETFGSDQVLADTKFELVDALPGDGIAVFNADNARSLPLYRNAKCTALISGNGEAYNAVALDAEYRNARSTARGTEFTLTVGDETAEMITPLIGEHIPSVVTQCALLAHRLGVSLPQIKKAATTLKAVAHRQELLYNVNGVVIDDSYNASVEGARSALNTLKTFDYVRVIVTPGIVELGKAQYAANYELGCYAATVVHYAVFIGGNGAALKSGALDGGLTVDRIFVVRDLSSATEILKTIQGERAILFENDLPDNY